MIQLDYTQILKDISVDREAAMRNYYSSLREYFLNWARKRFPNLSESDLTDAYQESLTIFFENLTKGSFIEQNANLTTYLVGIGNNIILKRLKKSIRTTLMDDFDTTLIDEVATDEWDEAYVRRLRKGFAMLGEQCQEILKLFYYQGLDIDEITSLRSYDSKNVTAATKSRCLAALKNYIQKIK